MSVLPAGMAIPTVVLDVIIPLTAGAGLAVGAAWGRMLAAVALGALAYTSINSLGWALAEPDRRTYGIPMAVGAVGSLLAVIVLLTG